MEEKNSCLDVEFIKAYLQSSIELETQKRIAEQTFNELLREENQWKQKMSYVAKKRYTKFFFPVQFPIFETSAAK